MMKLLRRNRNLLLFAAFYLLLVFLIWKQLTRQITNDREETVFAAIQHNNNLVIALEQHTIRTIRDADATMLLVQQEYLQKDSATDLKKLINSGMLDVPFLKGLIIADCRGRVVLRYPDRPGAVAGSVSDQGYFTAHAQMDDTLLISKTFLPAEKNEPVVVISRRISGSDGSFQGMIAMQLLPSTFMAFYSQASLKKYDILSLISLEGMTFSRRTGAIESSGENIRKSPLFKHVAQAPVGNYFAPDAIRQIPTYFSYRRIKNFPIIATVGSTEAEILAGFRVRQQREYIFGFITCFLLLVFLLLVLFSLRHRKKVMQMVRRSEAKYRSIFESTLDAVLLVKPDRSIEAMNQASVRLFGVSKQKDDNLLFEQLFARSEPEIRYSVDAKNCFEIENKETVFQGLDGRKFVGEIACSSFTDGRGHWYSLVLIRDVTKRKRIEQKLQNEQKRYQRIMTRQIIIAQEKERESIGHELHDNVNQILTTVKLYLETALHRKDEQKELISHSIKYILQCINEIRSLSHTLSAPTLGTQSLVDSLQALIENVAGCTDFTINLCVEKYKQPLGKELSLALYRIAQEQLNNIIKHARATSVTIQLIQSDNETELVITDNGRGFDPAAKNNGIGLSNISSRVKAFNGKVAIETAIGQGCTVWVSLPHQYDCEVPNE